jgi:hypothetical protein
MPFSDKVVLYGAIGLTAVCLLRQFAQQDEINTLRQMLQPLPGPQAAAVPQAAPPQVELTPAAEAAVAKLPFMKQHTASLDQETLEKMNMEANRAIANRNQPSQ